MKASGQIGEVSGARSRRLLGRLDGVGAQSRREISRRGDELSPPERESSSGVVARAAKCSRRDDSDLQLATFNTVCRSAD